jgi:hypothetical protein
MWGDDMPSDPSATGNPECDELQGKLIAVMVIVVIIGIGLLAYTMH